MTDRATDLVTPRARACSLLVCSSRRGWPSHARHRPAPASSYRTRPPRPTPCSFGKDTEDSVVMMLSRNGADQRAGLPLRGAAAWIKPRLQAAVGPPPL